MTRNGELAKCVSREQRFKDSEQVPVLQDIPTRQSEAILSGFFPPQPPRKRDNTFIKETGFVRGWPWVQLGSGAPGQ